MCPSLSVVTHDLEILEDIANGGVGLDPSRVKGFMDRLTEMPSMHLRMWFQGPWRFWR